MQFLPLLGQPLKSDAIIDLLEHWEADVVYAFDRDNEGEPDANVPRPRFLFDVGASPAGEHRRELPGSASRAGGRRAWP